MKIAPKKIAVFLLGMVFLLVLSVFVSMLGTEGKYPMLVPAEDPDAVPVVSAPRLIKEFAEDRVATLTKYQGRVWIRGRVTEISGPTLTLESPPGIHCVYVSRIDQICIQVRTIMGQEITIEGNLSGRNSGNLHLFRPWKRKV